MANKNYKDSPQSQFHNFQKKKLMLLNTATYIIIPCKTITQLKFCIIIKGVDTLV